MSFVKDSVNKEPIVDNVFTIVSKAKQAIAEYGNDDVVNETIGMSRKARYRNKAQYPIRKVGEEVVIGFFAQKSHYVVPVTDCILQPAHHEEILKKVKAFLEAYDVSIINI